MKFKKYLFKKFIQPFFKYEIQEIEEKIKSKDFQEKEIENNIENILENIGKKQYKDSYNNDTLFSVGNRFENHKKIGEWIYYFKNIKKIQKKIRHSLKKDELIEEYYQNGSLKLKRVEVENEIRIEKYFITGELQSVEILEETSFSEKRYEYIFYKTGALKEKKEILNGLITGINEFFSEDGILLRKTSFQNGKKEGLEKVFYENGILKSLIDYKKGLKEGAEKHFYENGQLKTYGINQNDILQNIGKFDEKGNN
ncbi:MAG: hypothetical protein KGV57_02195 [Fusobacterium sp.]|nr:hypothetical protein [Fusobacterium sp.]